MLRSKVGIAYSPMVSPRFSFSCVKRVSEWGAKGLDALDLGVGCPPAEELACAWTCDSFSLRPCVLFAGSDC